MTDEVTIIVSGAPYGDEGVWNAMRLSQALVSSAAGLRVNLFLLGDAVAAAKRGQATPSGYYNLEEMLRGLLEKGVKVAVCGTCIRARGLAMGELVEGVQPGSMLALAAWIKESSKVLSF